MGGKATPLKEAVWSLPWEQRLRMMSLEVKKREQTVFARESVWNDQKCRKVSYERKSLHAGICCHQVTQCQKMEILPSCPLQTG